jgi:hypothetical protein
MKGYEYQIRRFALKRIGAKWCDGMGAANEHVCFGKIDRANVDSRLAILAQLARLADLKANTTICRYRVLWRRSPRGRFASLFRDLHADCVI